MSENKNIKFKKCPGCGYELKKITGFRCPRCNQVILKKCSECNGCSIYNPGKCNQ